MDVIRIEGYFGVLISEECFRMLEDIIYVDDKGELPGVVVIFRLLCRLALSDYYSIDLRAPRVDDGRARVACYADAMIILVVSVYAA